MDTLTDKKNDWPKCNDRLYCHACRKGRCTILTSTYKNGRCPFQKRVRGEMDRRTAEWTRDGSMKRMQKRLKRRRWKIV